MFKVFTKYLFYKIGLLVVIFSVSLTALIFFTVDYYYTEQDTLLDAQELYFYTKMVSDWGGPPDTSLIKKDVDNLHYFRYSMLSVNTPSMFALSNTFLSLIV